jgi:hypothetical protein
MNLTFCCLILLKVIFAQSPDDSRPASSNVNRNRPFFAGTKDEGQVTVNSTLSCGDEVEYRIKQLPE